MAVEVGDLVDGKYRVESKIGGGAMGVVYAARDVELNERVALKFLTPTLETNETARARFAREAKNAFPLRSAHVAHVLDVGQLESGAPFIVMELLEGRTLRQYVESHGKLSVDESVWILLQTCSGVADAHSRGIVHRDLKPENIFLARAATGGDVVKVLDFGISKASSPEKREPSLTAHDRVVGTPRFMSPEQLESTAEATPKTDVWAIGVLAYWMITGKYPFDAETAPLIMAAVFTGKPVPVAELASDLDPGIAAVIMGCITRDANARYPDAAAVRRALQPFKGSSGGLRATTPERMPDTFRSNVTSPDAPTLEREKPVLPSEGSIPKTERSAAPERVSAQISTNRDEAPIPTKPSADPKATPGPMPTVPESAPPQPEPDAPAKPVLALPLQKQGATLRMETVKDAPKEAPKTTPPKATSKEKSKTVRMEAFAAQPTADSSSPPVAVPSASAPAPVLDPPMQIPIQPGKTRYFLLGLMIAVSAGLALRWFFTK